MANRYDLGIERDFAHFLGDEKFVGEKIKSQEPRVPKYVLSTVLAL